MILSISSTMSWRQIAFRSARVPRFTTTIAIGLGFARFGWPIADVHDGLLWVDTGGGTVAGKRRPIPEVRSGEIPAGGSLKD
jgi:hypothetical protein